MRPAILVLAALLFIVAGFAGGRALAGRSQPAQAFDFNAASYRPVVAAEGLSVAGFSGLEEGSGISGSLLLSGKVVSLSGHALTMATQAGPATLQIEGDRPLRRLASGTASDVAAGASVIVRLDPVGDAATGVLVIARP